jgi:ABC-2 type transport system permease protein
VRSWFTRWRTAAWLGWQIDANWTDPFTFVIYSIARPLAVALMLAFMYRAVAGQAMRPEVFASLFLASAFHEYVNRVSVGAGWSVVEEREEYETLKYVVASPLGMQAYLLGRSSVKMVLASIGVTLTLVVGWTLLHVRWNWAHVSWPAFVLVFALGLVATLSLALLMGGAALMLPRIAITLNEGLAVALNLLCGVLFPIDLLPRGLQELSLALPLTWWYEALRRVLLGHGASTRLGALSDAALIGGLALITLAWAALARWGYDAFERRARRLGKLDQTTLF